MNDLDRIFIWVVLSAVASRAYDEGSFWWWFWTAIFFAWALVLLSTAFVRWLNWRREQKA